MSKISRYSPELRERTVRMVVENRPDYPSEWAAFTAISKLFGMSPETLRTWVRMTQVDTGSRPGITSDERAWLKQLEREVKDLRRTNAILKDAFVQVRDAYGNVNFGDWRTSFTPSNLG